MPFLLALCSGLGEEKGDVWIIFWTGFVEVDNETGANTVRFTLVNLCNIC